MAKLSHAAAPLLETPRLRLRPFRADDLEAHHAMWCEPEVYQHIAGRPATREESWSGILRTIGHWQVLDFGYWALEDKATGTLIGNVGFGDFKRDITPDMNETPEAGWALATAFHGQGLATEAMRITLAWGDQNLAAQKTACIIAPSNLASLRVAEKLGFKRVAETTYKDGPEILLHRERYS